MPAGTYLELKFEKFLDTSGPQRVLVVWQETARPLSQPYKKQINQSIKQTKKPKPNHHKAKALFCNLTTVSNAALLVILFLRK